MKIVLDILSSSCYIWGMKDYLDKLSEAYYKGQPLVSDEEFDRLAETHSYNAVGAADGDVPHHFRMYSLQKVHFGEDEPKLQDPVTTIKLDGAAISILYTPTSAGVLKLTKILTRGDGIKGKDITEKLKHLVPNEIAGTTIVQANAEVVAPTEISNARNYAAGALNLKDINEIKKRDIYVVCYDILGADCETYNERLRLASYWGFTTVFMVLDRFPSDGSVIRENNIKLFEDAGYTSKHPRAAYALKPEPQSVVTKLLDVKWAVGRTGVVSPVAILEPVKIGDATVSKATLHNIEYIDNLGLEIGCYVTVIRSGEIIPRVVGRLPEEYVI